LRLPVWRVSNVLKGLVIYSAGDTIAALFTGAFSLTRLVGIMAVGGFIYSWEIPAWFDYINGRFRGLQRVAMAVAYFNPLWIARHLALICILTGQGDGIGTGLLIISLKSFAANLPVALAANYLIQIRIPLGWRFFASEVFSSIMAIYYPLCGVIFR